VPADPAEHRFVLHESFPAEAARHVQHIERRRVLSVASGVSLKRCGFGSEETMRRSFPRLLTITPRTTPPASDREAGGCTGALGANCGLT
jgi:hypothetical protein